MRPRTAVIGRTMVGVACCVLLFALARVAGMERLATLLLFTFGPIIGAVVERLFGGPGLLGGTIGGIISYIGYGVACYLLAYLSPEGITTDLLGPVWGFFLLAFSGAVVGAAVGVLVSVVAAIAEQIFEDEPDESRVS